MIAALLLNNIEKEAGPSNPVSINFPELLFLRNLAMKALNCFIKLFDFKVYWGNRP